MMGLEEDSDVGIGVVYEQFMLNELLRRVVRENRITSVLESPCFGMAGLSGINSMGLSSIGVRVTIGDDDPQRLELARSAWGYAGKEATFIHVNDFGALPFSDEDFELVYCFAALWHLKDPKKAIEEMGRVSDGVVLICMPNALNPMFQLRRLSGRLPANHRWADMGRICAALSENGMEIAEKGVLDAPPWPDTVVPLKGFMSSMGLNMGRSWRWSMLDYHAKKAPTLEKVLARYRFIEDAPALALLREAWAHHRYVVARKVK